MYNEKKRINKNCKYKKKKKKHYIIIPIATIIFVFFSKNYFPMQNLLSDSSLLDSSSYYKYS